MVKIIVTTIPKKSFEEHYGKYGYAVTEKCDIHLKGSIKNKNVIRETLKHEVGHVFADRRKIIRKLPVSEKRKLIKDKDVFRALRERKGMSGKAKMQEIAADLYAFAKTRKQELGERYVKKKYPQSRKIIKKEMKKFKAKLVRK